MVDILLPVEEYIRWMIGIQGVRRNSARTYATKLKKYVRWLGRDPLTANEQDVGDFMIFLKAQKQGVNSQRMFITCLKGFYKWAQEKRKRSGNPAKNLKPLREFRKHPEILRVEEVERMIVTAGLDNFQQARNAAMIAVLADTGIRISELLELRVGNIQKEEKQFIMTVPATKASSQRMVPFCYVQEGSLIAEVFGFYWLQVKLQRGWKADDYLFQRDPVCWVKRGNAWTEGKLRWFSPGQLSQSSVGEMLKRIAERAGVERNVTAHMFRHFYATYLAVSGMDIHKIQQRLGHASLDRTERYIHYADLVKADSSRNNPMSGSKSQFTGPVKLLKTMGENQLKIKN